ncbi:hypothetical protein [Spirillospora sp. NPDC029432]|uniref:hypothetical protein n=1 Tax=Spirillospora sp. NPDC029432 TaxID=3154599 RepID=UPI0034558C1D
MTIRDFGAALWRNRLVALAVAALTLAALLHVKTAAPDYEQRSAITLLSPRSPFPRNAYASFTPAMVTNAEISVRILSSEQGRRLVLAAGGRGEFQVLLANRGNQEMPIHDQPHITVAARDATAAGAQRTHAAVLQVLRRQLLDRQSAQGAAPGSLISWQVTAGTGRAVPLTGRPSRRLLAVALLGGMIMLYAAVAADRRRNGNGSGGPGRGHGLLAPGGRGLTIPRRFSRTAASPTSATNVKFVVK